MALPLQGDVDWDREETHQFYVNRAWRGPAEDPLDPAWELDPIQPDLVGCIDLTAIGSTRKKLFGAWGITIDALRGVVNMPLQPQWQEEELENERKREKKRQLWIAPSPFAARYKTQLTVGCGLLVLNRGPAYSACGLFGVPKKDNLLRVIFDARMANSKLSPVPASLVLFTIDQLVRAWATAARLGDTYILNIDFRHYYYQLKIPPYLIPHVIVSIGGVEYHPAVLPMGFRDACGMAQAVTWCIVLHREPGEADLGVDDALVKGPIMPAFLPLKEGGAIFVLLDGVFIINTSPAQHQLWAARMTRNERLFKVRRKVGHSLRLVEAGTEHVTVRGEQSPVHPLTTEASTFAGITFESRNHLRPAKALPDPEAGSP